MPVAAADPPGFKLWKAGELKQHDEALRKNVAADHSSRETLADYGDHRFRMLYRDADGNPEQHDAIIDIVYVQSGEGALALGGTMAGRRGTNPGEWVGTRLDGADRHPAGSRRHRPHSGRYSAQLPRAAGEAHHLRAAEDSSEVAVESSPLDALGDLDGLIGGFLACSLREEQWTHHAHLAVGLWHVEQFGAEEAFDRLRQGIRRLNESFGNVNTPTNGYHETITGAYVRLLAQFLAECPPDLPFADRVNLLISGPLAGKQVLLGFYTEETLGSSRARLAWQEPDLSPLNASALLAPFPR